MSGTSKSFTYIHLFNPHNNLWDRHYTYVNFTVEKVETQKDSTTFPQSQNLLVQDTNPYCLALELILLIYISSPNA